MSKKTREYTKLSGNVMRSGTGSLFASTRSFCRLWMGSDHLLQTERHGYTETYKRFYFRDIQAIIIRKTKRVAVWTIVLATLALLLFALGLAVADLAGRITIWVFAGVFAVIGIINFLFGPSCVTYVKTAVQTEELPAWKRVRAARKGKQAIRARVLQAQGEIPADEIRIRLEDILRSQTENFGASPQ